MKKISLIAGLLMAAMGAYAQDATTTSSSTGGDGADFAPAAGDFSAALLLGRGNFYSNSLNVTPTVYSQGSSWTVPGTAPYNNTVEANSNDITNMVGAEVRYFLMDNIALKLSGGAIIRNTPARENIPAFIDNSTNQAAWIPAYASVQADNRVETNINIGGEYHFSSKYSRVFPYAGLTIPFYYARQSYYDPAIVYPSSTSSSGDIDVVDIGIRSTEITGFGGQLVGGFDFYVYEGMYFGFEIKPVSVVYGHIEKSPGPGLESGEAETTTWSFFSQPFVKIGFRF